MVGIVVHVDLPRGIDIEFEAAFDPLEGRQRTPQSLCVERPSFGAGGAPHRRDGRDGVFDVDPAGDPQRAVGDHTRRRDQIVAVVPALDELHVAGVEVAGGVVGVAVDRDGVVAQRHVDACFEYQRAARPDALDELCEGLLHGFVGAVDVEMVGVYGRDDRHVGP